MMEVVMAAGDIRRGKLQSNYCHQHANTQFLTDRMPFLSPNRVKIKSLKGKCAHFTYF